MTAHAVVARDRSRRLTSGTRKVLAGTVGVLILVGAALLVAMGVSSRTAPAAPAVAEEFVTGAVDADADVWHPLLSPALAQRFDATGGTPLIGDPAVLQMLTVTHSVAAPRYVLATSDLPSDEQHADTAIVPVRLVFDTGIEDQRRIELEIELVLSRPFAYDPDGRKLQNARAEGTPTAIGPWRVSAISAGAGARGSLTFPDAGVCTSGARVLTDLSDVARIEGRISDSCLLEGRSVGETVDAGVDPASLAKDMPVLSPAALPHELSGLPASSGVTLRVHRLDTTSGPVLAVIAEHGIRENGGAQDDDAHGDDAQGDDSRAALLVLRALAGAP